MAWQADSVHMVCFLYHLQTYFSGALLAVSFFAMHGTALVLLTVKCM
jgi:hypothetical protein